MKIEKKHKGSEGGWMGGESDRKKEKKYEGGEEDSGILRN